MSGKSPVRSPALPKAGSESSFAYIWTQRGSEFPEIQWNTALQNSVCISGSDKKMDIWHLYTLPTLVRESLGEPAALPGLPAAWTCSSHSFGPILHPSMLPTALAWGLTLRISNTTNPSMLYQCVSWKKQQAAREEFRPPPVTSLAWGMGRLDHALGMRRVTASTLSLLRHEREAHMRPVADFSTLLAGAHANKEIAIPT